LTERDAQFHVLGIQAWLEILLAQDLVNGPCIE